MQVGSFELAVVAESVCTGGSQSFLTILSLAHSAYDSYFKETGGASISEPYRTLSNRLRTTSSSGRRRSLYGPRASNYCRVATLDLDQEYKQFDFPFTETQKPD